MSVCTTRAATIAVAPALSSTATEATLSAYAIGAILAVVASGADFNPNLFSRQNRKSGSDLASQSSGSGAPTVEEHVVGANSAAAFAPAATSGSESFDADCS